MQSSTRSATAFTKAYGGNVNGGEWKEVFHVFVVVLVLLVARWCWLGVDRETVVVGLHVYVCVYACVGVRSENWADE